MGWTPYGFSGDENRPWHGGADDASDGLGDIPADDSLRALIAHDYLIHDMPVSGETPAETVIVPGDGVSMGQPFIARRERPLTLRIAALALMTCILVTGVFSMLPLSADQMSASSAFQALAGSMVWSHQPGYFFYTAGPGDTPASVAKKFHVQVGGIYELNDLYAGEEFGIGIAYKIPDDPTYGRDYQPTDVTGGASGNFGNKRYGSNWWNSMAGTGINGESLCGPDGGSNPLAYHLTSPNWNSYWMRGFIVYGTWVYHTGVDLAAARGNPIHAAQQGQVIWAGYDATNGLGWSVKIDHCNHVSTVYGHMDKLLVSVGDTVLQGQVIGLEGSTGNSFGPHLHYMVEWNNLWVDPMPFYASKYTISHYVAP